MRDYASQSNGVYILGSAPWKNAKERVKEWPSPMPQNMQRDGWTLVQTTCGWMACTDDRRVRVANSRVSRERAVVKFKEFLASQDAEIQG